MRKDAMAILVHLIASRYLTLSYQQEYASDSSLSAGHHEHKKYQHILQMKISGIGKKIKKHIATLRRGGVFETRKIEFKEKYDLYNNVHKKINRAVQAEFIKDVMSIANSLPDPESDTGLLIMGVTKSGDIVDDYVLPVHDVAELNQIINGVLERPIVFSYREYEINDKKIGVIIIPRSSNIPHVVKNSLWENEKIFLRRGECWTRTEGAKTVAMASDFDDIYEYLGGINKFQSIQKRRRLEAGVKKKKTPTQADKLKILLSLDNQELNEQIKRLLNK